MHRRLALLLVILAASCGSDDSDGTISPEEYCGAVAGWGSTSAEDEVVALVNMHRQNGASCGGQAMPAVAPLAADQRLRCAARAHSLDMTERSFFDHTNPDGLEPWDRMILAGYSWSFAGENIVQGSSTAAGAMQLWMNSPPHCMNIMSGDFEDLGVGYHAEGANWTQVFGAPR